MSLPPTTFVQINGNVIRYSVNNLAEAKIALKELKLIKKEFGMVKRNIMAQQKEIRSSYTHEVRCRGSIMRGGGGFGAFVRVIQTISRDSHRVALANALAPLENERIRIEYRIGVVDSLILRLESQSLSLGVSASIALTTGNNRGGRL